MTNKIIMQQKNTKHLNNNSIIHQPEEVTKLLSKASSTQDSNNSCSSNSSSSSGCCYSDKSNNSDSAISTTRTSSTSSTRASTTNDFDVGVSSSSESLETGSIRDDVYDDDDDDDDNDDESNSNNVSSSSSSSLKSEERHSSSTLEQKEPSIKTEKIKTNSNEQYSTLSNGGQTTGVKRHHNQTNKSHANFNRPQLVSNDNSLQRAKQHFSPSTIAYSPGTTIYAPQPDTFSFQAPAYYNTIVPHFQPTTQPTSNTLNQISPLGYQATGTQFAIQPTFNSTSSDFNLYRINPLEHSSVEENSYALTQNHLSYHHHHQPSIIYYVPATTTVTSQQHTSQSSKPFNQCKKEIEGRHQKSAINGNEDEQVVEELTNVDDSIKTASLTNLPPIEELPPPPTTINLETDSSRTLKEEKKLICNDQKTSNQDWRLTQAKQDQDKVELTVASIASSTTKTTPKANMPQNTTCSMASTTTNTDSTKLFSNDEEEENEEEEEEEEEETSSNEHYDENSQQLTGYQINNNNQILTSYPQPIYGTTITAPTLQEQPFLSSSFQHYPFEQQQLYSQTSLLQNSFPTTAHSTQLTAPISLHQYLPPTYSYTTLISGGADHRQQQQQYFLPTTTIYDPTNHQLSNVNNKPQLILLPTTTNNHVRGHHNALIQPQQTTFARQGMGYCTNQLMAAQYYQIPQQAYYYQQQNTNPTFFDSLLCSPTQLIARPIQPQRPPLNQNNHNEPYYLAATTQVSTNFRSHHQQHQTNSYPGEQYYQANPYNTKHYETADIVSSINSQPLNTRNSSNSLQQQPFDDHISHNFTTNNSYDNLLSMLPIDAEPTKTRQAYGMDKVWLDEFEQLFSQFITFTNIIWTLAEVESNPSISESKSIVAYRGRYIINKNLIEYDDVNDEIDKVELEHKNGSSVDLSNSYHNNNDSSLNDNTKGGSNNNDEKEESNEQLPTSTISDCKKSADCCVHESLSDKTDQDSGVSIDNCSSFVSLYSKSTDDGNNETIIEGKEEETKTSTCDDSEDDKIESQVLNTTTSLETRKEHQTKFRMFIDSAKVRFCCDNCGHGWTSMKGRVVFWYELFELVSTTSDDYGPSKLNNFENYQGSSQLIGYCAYKLFGQRCDICKIENRFERPMWYPEEVTKVLNNLYNKIGQIYFGFKMPNIDKQRRAGKPKTSHNSSLCQACNDGVCTDRK